MDRSNSCSEHWRTAARAAHSFADGLRRLQDHIFTDEQDAYPYAIQTLPPGQWDMVDDAHVNMSS